ncbi:MAG: SGNH/GDSL hydrolase family protein [Chthoniobacteraceae bacterium]
MYLAAKKLCRQFSALMRKHRAVALLLAFTLLIIELICRLVFPLPEEDSFNRINYSALLQSPSQARPRHLANASFVWSSSPDGATFRHDLNLYGFRDRTWSLRPRAGSRRVMFVGDSFVEGFMAEGTETIPAGFDHAAKSAGRPFEYMNLGVGAAQPQDYCNLIRDAVPLFRPDDLVVVFYANDFPSPDFESSWLTPDFTANYPNPWMPRLFAVIGRMFSHQSVPLCFHHSAFSFVAPVPDPRNPWSSRETAETYKRFVSPKIAAAMQNGTFNPYAVNLLALDRTHLSTEVDMVPLLKALSDFSARHSCKLSVVYVPSANQVSDAYLPYRSEYAEDKHPASLMDERYQLHARLLKAPCAQLGIPFLDMTPQLREQESAGRRLYWNYDPHMKGSGYLMLG